MTTFKVEQSIINSIDSIEEEHVLVVYDNNTTPFQDVVNTFQINIPCPAQYAYIMALIIQNDGKCVVLESNLSHCLKVKGALEKIKVESKIFSVSEFFDDIEDII